MRLGRRRERGTVSVLVIGFFLVAALMVAAVVDASAAYLRRQGLANLADSAALAAADGVKAEQAYAAEPTTIDVDAARRYATAYLEQADAEARYHGLNLVVGVSGDAVTVRLQAPLELPIVPPGWDSAPVVVVESAALVLTHSP